MNTETIFNPKTDVFDRINHILVQDTSLLHAIDELVIYFSTALNTRVTLIYQYHPATDNLILNAHKGVPNDVLSSMSSFNMGLGEGGVVHFAFKENQFVRINNFEEMPITVEFMSVVKNEQLNYGLFLPVSLNGQVTYVIGLCFTNRLPAEFEQDYFVKLLGNLIAIALNRLELNDKLLILDKQVMVDRKIITQKSTDIQKKTVEITSIEDRLRGVVSVMLTAYSDLEDLISKIFNVMADLLKMETIGMGRIQDEFIILDYVFDKENILRVGDQFPALDHFKVDVKKKGKQERMEMKNPFTLRQYVNHPVYMHLGFTTFFSTPIVKKDKPFGVLFAASKDIQTISSFEEDMLYFLAQKLSFELEKREMIDQIYNHSKEVERSNQQLKTINMLGQSITSILDLDPLLMTILKSLTDISECEDASLFIYDDSTDELEIVMVASDAHKSIEGFRLPSTKGIAGWVFTNLRSQIVNSTREDERHSTEVDELLNYKTESILCSPIKDFEGKAYGVIELINKKDNSGYTLKDQEYLELLIPFITIALKNSQLFIIEQEATRKAQQAQELKSEFLSNMSHELRTPLTSIIAYADILMRDYNQFSQVQQKSIDRIKTSSKHLLNLINDILDLSKIEAGMMTIKNEEVNIGSIVHAATSTFDAQAVQKGLELKVTDPQTPVISKTDEMRLKQILMNLISNAIKFTEKGGVYVSFESNEDSVYIDISDTGPGIPKEYQDVIFESFRQLDGSASRRAGGTGLGLSISQKIVKLLNGDLTLQSEPGKGSTFRVTLPLEKGMV